MQSLTGGMAQYQQQQQAAADHNTRIEIAKRQWDDEAKRRRIAALYEIQEADMAQRQANDASTQSKSEIAREMLRAREEAKAAASAAGVMGNSLNRMLTDMSITEQQKRALVDTNRDNIVNTQQLQKYKAIEGSKMDPLYYTEMEGGNFFSSMLGVIPSLFSLGNFSFSSGCSPTTTVSSCPPPRIR
jgi:hypothetical protein